MKMYSNFIITLNKEYGLDGFSMTLFLLVSFSFPAIYKFLIPLILGFTFVQFYRFKTQKLSMEVLANSYLYLLVFSLPFHRSVHTILLVICIIIHAYAFFTAAGARTLKFSKFQLYVLVFFGLILVNQLIHRPILKGIETFLYLLLYPILFVFVKNLSFRPAIVKLLKTYITAALVSIIYLLIINLFFNKIHLEANTYFSSYLGLIHVYFGMLVGLSACFIIALKATNINYLAPYVDYGVLTLLIAILAYIGARAALLAVIFVIPFAAYHKMKMAWYKKSILLIFLFVGMLYISYQAIPRVKNGVENLTKVYTSIKTNDKEDLVHNSWRNMYKRALVLKYTFDELNEHPVVGIGNRNVKTKISDKILVDGFLYFEPMNTHNQYLHFLVGMGFPSFLFFLWILFAFVKAGFQHKWALYFMIFFLLSMLTESMLVRNKGIALFFLFYLIFTIEFKPKDA